MARALRRCLGKTGGKSQKCEVPDIRSMKNPSPETAIEPLLLILESFQITGTLGLSHRVS